MRHIKKGRAEEEGKANCEVDPAVQVRAGLGVSKALTVFFIR